jgi:hypothetical protein
VIAFLFSLTRIFGIRTTAEIVSTFIKIKDQLNAHADKRMAYANRARWKAAQHLSDSYDHDAEANASREVAIRLGELVGTK